MPVDEPGFLNWVTVAVGAILFIIMLYTSLVSLREHESRAALRSLILAAILPLPYLAAGFIGHANSHGHGHGVTLPLVLLSITALGLLFVFFPAGRRTKVEDDTPRRRIDERNTMFSRRLLELGSDRYEEYYRRNPGKREPDDRFRTLPGLLDAGAKYYHAYTFPAAQASFSAVESFHPFVTGKTTGKKTRPDPKDVTAFIKEWALRIGAVSVGIAELKDYHFYSTVGRGSDYGRTITPDHGFAVVLTVEMDRYMLDRAPFGPAVMESAQQYLASGAIALQIAGFIRNLGYPARAHIDASYRVVCPLVARDAGLGEIGRMGLLMTPELGPRVRISAVTTGLPLVPDRRVPDHSVRDFCTHCRKCADVCPSRAIPSGDRVEIDGVRRWQINSEDCYTFWCATGTDCGRCVSVCPYSHPRALAHNLVRAGVRRFPAFRRLAIWMDDFLYGRKPPPRDLPAWMKTGETYRAPGPGD